MEQLREEEFDNLAPGSPRLYIPAGVYPARWLRYEERATPWGKKLAFEYAVEMASGPNSEAILLRWYNFSRDKAGRLVFGNGSDYRKDWIQANGGKLPAQWNRLPPSIFRKSRMLVRVVDVAEDAQGPFPRSLVYSRIDRIVRPVWPGETFKGSPLQECEITRRSDEILGVGEG